MEQIEKVLCEGCGMSYRVPKGKELADVHDHSEKSSKADTGEKKDSVPQADTQTHGRVRGSTVGEGEKKVNG